MHIPIEVTNLPWGTDLTDILTCVKIIRKGCLTALCVMSKCHTHSTCDGKGERLQKLQFGDRILCTLLCRMYHAMGKSSSCVRWKQVEIGWWIQGSVMCSKDRVSSSYLFRLLFGRKLKKLAIVGSGKEDSESSVLAGEIFFLPPVYMLHPLKIGWNQVFWLEGKFV